MVFISTLANTQCYLMLCFKDALNDTKTWRVGPKINMKKFNGFGMTWGWINLSLFFSSYINISSNINYTLTQTLIFGISRIEIDKHRQNSWEWKTNQQKDMSASHKNGSFVATETNRRYLKESVLTVSKCCPPQSLPLST